MPFYGKRRDCACAQISGNGIEVDRSKIEAKETKSVPLLGGHLRPKLRLFDQILP
jgi:hypothetical protein